MSTAPVPLMNPERIPGSLYVLRAYEYAQVQDRRSYSQENVDAAVAVLLLEISEILLGRWVRRVPVLIVYMVL